MVLDRFRLDGKVAIVTGCSTGLGQSLAVGLAEAGADIVGIFNATPPGQTKSMVEQLGRQFLGIKADISHVEIIQDVISRTIGAMGRVDILVNNAGLIRRNHILDFNEKDWDDVMAVNLKSMFFLCQAVARQFIDQQAGGKIINIASLHSFMGGILVPSYTASKHGVLGLTRILANELAVKDINVNAIAPGYLVTDLTKKIRDDPVRNADTIKRIPAGRWGSPEDIQGAAVYLASEASRYAHGTVITVDGGWMVH